MTPFTHAARDFARANRSNDKAILAMEVRAYSRSDWWFRHVVLTPEDTLLSKVALAATCAPLVDRRATLVILRQAREQYAEIKDFAPASPTGKVMRRCGLDALKILWHGEVRKLYGDTATRHANAIGNLLLGEAAE